MKNKVTLMNHEGRFSLAGLVIRSAERFDLVKIKPTES